MESESAAPVIVETPLEKRRRQARESQARRRARKKLEEKSAKLPTKQNLNKDWAYHAELFAKSEPAKYAAYVKRHSDVTFLQDELDLVKIGLQEKLPAMPKDAIEFNGEKEMPRPDENYKAIADDIQKNGERNYCQIEANITLGNTPFVDEVSEAYRLFGLQLRLDHSHLKDARECFLLWALQSNDESIDKDLLNCAISEWISEPWKTYDTERLLWDLIRKHREGPND